MCQHKDVKIRMNSQQSIGTPIASDNLERFLDASSGQDAEGIVTHLHDLNSGEDPLEKRFATIVFLPPRAGTVGHFCLLSDWGTNLEWFDSLAGTIPEEVQRYAEKRQLPIAYNRIALQGKTSNVCGKWCLARMYSLPTSIGEFVKIYKGNKYYSPDEIVNKQIVLKWKQ